MTNYLTFQKGGAYIADLISICNEVRQNGSNQNVAEFCVNFPGQEVDVKLLINLAYQPNVNLAPASQSVYLLGFKNSAGTYVFNTFPAPHNYLMLPLDGSYKGLGYATGFGKDFVITNENLRAAIASLQYHVPGNKIDEVIKNALTRLIIGSSEAIRSKSVGDGINSILGTTGLYAPDWDIIHSWNGQGLGW